MNIKPTEPVREFRVGYDDHPITLKDCAHISLEADEQITLLGPEGSEVDVVRKEWGYYAIPSLNGRLLRFGLHAALIRSEGDGKFFVLLVEDGKQPAFHDYLAQTHQQLVCWLDDTETLNRLASLMQA